MPNFWNVYLTDNTSIAILADDVQIANQNDCAVTADTVIIYFDSKVENIVCQEDD